MAVCWQGANTGVLTWTLRASSDSTPGYRLTRTDSVVATAWTAKTVTVGTTNKGLSLAELLVWHTSLTVSQLGALQTYIHNRWGLSFPVSEGTSVSLPAAYVPPTNAWQILLNFEETPFVDTGSENQTITQTGTVSRSTTIFRFGTGSLYLGGSSYLTVTMPRSIPNTFYIRGWVYLTTFEQTICPFHGLKMHGMTLGPDNFHDWHQIRSLDATQAECQGVRTRVWWFADKHAGSPQVCAYIHAYICCRRWIISTTNGSTSWFNALEQQ